MKTVNVYKAVCAPLTGVNLIEASAGTGKTYNITFLVLRLLLEKNAAIDEILVVTFTRAATGELREKVRHRLQEALVMTEAFDGTGTTPVGDTASVVGRAVQRLGIPETTRRIRIALAMFDRAAIYSIHGFCNRLLSTHAFETGTDFQLSVVPDSSDYTMRIAENAYLDIMHRRSRLVAAYLHDNKVNPKNLKALATLVVPRPRLHFDPATPGDGVETDYRHAYATVRDIWRRERTSIVHLLMTQTSLNGNSFPKKRMANWFVQIDDTLARTSPQRVITQNDYLSRLTASNLAAKVKKGKCPPCHPFFMAVEKLHAAAMAFDGVMKAELLDFVTFLRHELPRRKRRHRVTFFDDFLLQLDEVLNGTEGQLLKTAVAARYRAALVDEFQDTDNIQYRVFHRLFVTQTIPFFMIGDPKQAIYAFRGGDIFAYMNAARALPSKETDTGRFTLGTNWRSDPGLVRAVNTLFTSHTVPFLFEDIAFFPVEPALGREDGITVSDVPVSPFQILFVARTEANCNKETHQRLPQLPPSGDDPVTRMTDDMVTLLNGQTRIHGQPVRPSDIAVLVRSNKQAETVRRHLAARGISAVTSASVSVFSTLAARELFDILRAVLDPGDMGKVRCAASTVALGYNWQGSPILRATADNDDTGEALCAAFEHLKDVFEKRGAIFFVRELLSTTLDGAYPGGVKQRVLASPFRHRYLVDFLHVLELLQREAAQKRMGPHRLHEHLERCLAAPDSADTDAAAQRPCSDIDAVQVVTIHKSKGLQYPVVYVPFVIRSAQQHRGIHLDYHDPDPPWTHRCELGTPSASAQRAARREAAAEDVRLLYVALTRARHLCKVVWGGFVKFHTHPFGILLHHLENAVDASCDQWTDADIKASIDDFGRRAGLSGVLVDGDTPSPILLREHLSSTDDTLAPRRFSGTVEPPVIAASFSSLTRDWASLSEGKNGHNRAVVDTVSSVSSRTVSEAAAAPFDRGIHFGLFVHHLMEHIDFSDESRIAAQLPLSLKAYGYQDAPWRDRIISWLHQVVHTPLHHLPNGLHQVVSGQRYNEVPFVLSCKRGVDTRHLARVLALDGDIRHRHYADDVAAREPRHLEGFLEGIIDMVFQHKKKWFIVDYKSNDLGDTPDGYCREELNDDMHRHDYILQYHLYLVALHRYLIRWLPGYSFDRDFGGVYYLYLRGMSPRFLPGTGIFFDKPPRERIEALDRLLRPPLVHEVTP